MVCDIRLQSYRAKKSEFVAKTQFLCLTCKFEIGFNSLKTVEKSMPNQSEILLKKMKKNEREFGL